MGKAQHTRRLTKRLMQVIRDDPALRGDFEDFTGRVRQVDEDFGRGEWIAFKAQPVVDSSAGRVAKLGTGFERSDHAAQSQRGGRGFKLGVEVGRQPVAEIGRAQSYNTAGVTVEGMLAQGWPF